MAEAYDATKDPRTGRPIPPQQKANDELDSALKEARRQHREEGIPPAELPSEDLVSGPVNSNPAAMKAPSGDWDTDGSSGETEESETEEPMVDDGSSQDVRAKTYQVSIENPAIAARDYEVEASGTVCIEEYRGDDLWCRITVEVTTTAGDNLTIAEANPALLDAAVEALSEVCHLDREMLHRCLVS